MELERVTDVELSDFEIARWKSPTGRVSVRLNLTIMGGVRVNVSHADWRLEYLTDYCAGPDRGMAIGLAGLVLSILAGVDEQIAPHALAKIWPKQTRRPMELDGECWQQLVALATPATSTTAAGGE